MPKEGKDLLNAYKQALQEGHPADMPWAQKTPQEWEQFEEDLKPKPKAEPKPEPKVATPPTPSPKKTAKKKPSTRKK